MSPLTQEIILSLFFISPFITKGHDLCLTNINLQFSSHSLLSTSSITKLIYFFINSYTLYLSSLSGYRANSKQEAPIYLRLIIAGDSADFSIKKHAKISNWDASKGRLKGNENDTKELNNYLLSIEASIKQNYKFLQTNSDFVTVKDLKNSYLGVVVNSRKKVIDVFKLHNQNIKELIGIDKTKATYTRYVTSCKRLQ